MGEGEESRKRKVWFWVLQLEGPGSFNINKNQEGMSSKVPAEQELRLYGSNVYDQRTKASSLYQKRNSLKWQDANGSAPYKSPQYQDYRSRTRLEEPPAFLSLSTAGQLESLPPPDQDSPTRTRLISTFTDSRANGKNQGAWDRAGKQETALRQSPGTSKRVDNFLALDRVSSSQGSGDYARIMEKLSKKEKIIQQLQKLCENKVSDKLRSSHGYEKGDYEVYSPVRTKKADPPKRFSITLAPSEETANNLARESPLLTQSLNFDFVKPQASSQTLAEELRRPERKKSDFEILGRNPEDPLAKDPLRTYVPVTSRETKEFTKARTPIESFEVSSSKRDAQQGKCSDLTASSRNNDSTYDEVYSPTKARKGKQIVQQKSVLTMRQALESRNVKVSGGQLGGRMSLCDFEVRKVLGEGKFGTVMQAVHRETNYLVALKKISKKVLKANLMENQLAQQIKIQSFCQHQNILKLYGFFDDYEHIYLILEYMEEGTLFSHLKLHKTLSEQDARFKIKDIVKAVLYLHDQGIAHRDIKPENIVMSNGVGKLCDFGWATICTDRRKTYCGTFDYVAPEILEGNDYDASVDLWCLGVLAYELLVGKAPFYHISRKETMKKIMNVQITEFPLSVSKQAVSFIQALVKKDPSQRMSGEKLLRHPFLQVEPL